MPLAKLRNLLRRSPRLVKLVWRVRTWNQARMRDKWQRRLKAAVRAALTAKPGACFVQIGSNDGRTGDPLFELVRSLPDCRGILVEPVPALFTRLRQNYPEDRFRCVNAAIAEESGERDFHLVSSEGVERLRARFPWAEQIGSFRREHIADCFDRVFAPYVITIKVPCKRLNELMAELAVTSVDVLHTDVEGYDYRVLLTLDWTRHHPAVVLYEHVHLPATEQAAAAALLRGHGYRLHSFGHDTLAIA